MSILSNGTLLQGGKYRIVESLGQGGFGITYLGEQIGLGRKVAIKEFFMKDLCNRDEETSQVSVGSEGSREMVNRFREKFRKEANSIAKLRHPNIVSVIDVFDENGTVYYVMEYCSGGSLASLMKQHPDGLSEALAVKYIREVAAALDYIHQRKINHLDVKPGNIMLTEEGNAVLIDFGLAKQYDVSTGQQTSSTPVGMSHGYAPIEQYKREGVSQFSPTTDIYSLGATLYKLVSGNTPPEAQTLIEEPLSLAFPASANVLSAINRAMQMRRTDRPQTVTEWLSILDMPADALPSVVRVVEETTEMPDNESTQMPDVESTQIAAKANKAVQIKPTPQQKAGARAASKQKAQSEEQKEEVPWGYVVDTACGSIFAAVTAGLVAFGSWDETEMYYDGFMGNFNLDDGPSILIFSISLAVTAMGIMSSVQLYKREEKSSVWCKLFAWTTFALNGLHLTICMTDEEFFFWPLIGLIYGLCMLYPIYKKSEE